MILIRRGFCWTCGDCCDPKLSEAREKAYFDAGVVFQKINRDDGERCLGFNEKTRLCKTYKDRPLSCRMFPLKPVDVAALPRCTFTFEVRK